MSAVASSSSSTPPRAEALRRRDSSSSDEDGLREVRLDELEDLDLPPIELPPALQPPQEPLAANQLNPHFNGNWEPEQSTLAKRIGTLWSLIVIFYLIAFTGAYIGVLTNTWDVKCHRHLHMWAVGQVVIQSLMILMKFHLMVFIARHIRNFDNLDPGINRQLSLWYFANRMLNFTWMSWWLVGLVLLAAGCSCGFLMILYFFFPQALVGGERIRGATHAQINKLPEEEYNPSESKVKTEDAMCAICLSPYEAGDRLRHLPCHHHFHSECIDQWLIKNKSCPFCKRQIDQEDNPSAPDQTHDEELGLAEIDHPEDAPINLAPLSIAAPSNPDDIV